MSQELYDMLKVGESREIPWHVAAEQFMKLKIASGAVLPEEIDELLEAKLAQANKVKWQNTPEQKAIVAKQITKSLRHAKSKGTLTSDGKAMLAFGHKGMGDDYGFVPGIDTKTAGVASDPITKEDVSKAVKKGYLSGIRSTVTGDMARRNSISRKRGERVGKTLGSLAGAAGGALIGKKNRLAGAALGTVLGYTGGKAIGEETDARRMSSGMRTRPVKRAAIEKTSDFGKEARVFGASLDDDTISNAGIPYGTRKQVFKDYLRAKSQEEPTPLGTALGTGALVGGGLGSLAGLKGGAPGALLGGSIGALGGAGVGALSRAVDKNAIARAQSELQQKDLSMPLAQRVGDAQRRQRSAVEASRERRHREMISALSKQGAAEVPNEKKKKGPSPIPMLVGGAALGALAGGGHKAYRLGRVKQIIAKKLGKNVSVMSKIPDVMKNQKLKDRVLSSAMTGAAVGTLGGAGTHVVRRKLQNRKNSIEKKAQEDGIPVTDEAIPVEAPVVPQLDPMQEEMQASAMSGQPNPVDMLLQAQQAVNEAEFFRQKSEEASMMAEQEAERAEMAEGQAQQTGMMAEQQAQESAAREQQAGQQAQVATQQAQMASQDAVQARNESLAAQQQNIALRQAVTNFRQSLMDLVAQDPTQLLGPPAVPEGPMPGPGGPPGPEGGPGGPPPGPGGMPPGGPPQEGMPPQGPPPGGMPPGGPPPGGPPPGGPPPEGAPPGPPTEPPAGPAGPPAA